MIARELKRRRNRRQTKGIVNKAQGVRARVRMTERESCYCNLTDHRSFLVRPLMSFSCFFARVARSSLFACGLAPHSGGGSDPASALAAKLRSKHMEFSPSRISTDQTRAPVREGASSVRPLSVHRMAVTSQPLDRDPITSGPTSSENSTRSCDED
jgi:hypothetical protein